MRFLANENMPGDAVTALAAAGHDIVWVRTASPGSEDKDILAWAVREDRVLLTFDQDFGELAWRAGLPASCGIVLFRIPMPAAINVGATLPPGLVNESIGLGTSLLFNRAAFGCARFLEANRHSW